MMSPTLRPLTVNDITQVAQLEAEIYDFPWSSQSFYDSLAAGHVCLLMEVDQRIIAYGVIMLAPGEAELLNLSVVLGQRRRGYGYSMLMELIAIAKRYGANQMFLEVRLSNTTAIAFYNRQGFSEVARRKAYYPALTGREDALVMRASL